NDTLFANSCAKSLCLPYGYHALTQHLQIPFFVTLHATKNIAHTNTNLKMRAPVSPRATL
ncbi:MAG: hypothetical protein KKF89_04925, partial [Nanoarchaeota archaeon]|nr:hypothetical protein [Nanoarchaeota archaeon]